MQLLRRAWVTAALLTFGTLALAPPGNAQELPSGWLELDAGPVGQIHQLEPGGSADWAVDVRIEGEPATALKVELQAAASNSIDVLRNYVTVELRACTQPWADRFCAEEMQVLMPATPLNSASGAQIDLLKSGHIVSDGAYVLLTATLAQDLPQEAQLSQTRIVLGVHGSADETAPAPSAPKNGLAHTGIQLGSYAILGFLTIAVGFLLTRSRRTAK